MGESGSIPSDCVLQTTSGTQYVEGAIYFELLPNTSPTPPLSIQARMYMPCQSIAREGTFASEVLVGFIVILARQSVWALGGFIGLTVGAGSDYATENIVEAENEAHCNELFPGQPELCDSIDPELSNLEKHQSVCLLGAQKQDVGLVVVNNQLPEDPTPENVAEAAAEVKPAKQPLLQMLRSLLPPRRHQRNQCGQF